MALNILGENWCLPMQRLSFSVIPSRAICSKKLKKSTVIYCRPSTSSFVGGKNTRLEKNGSTNLVFSPNNFSRNISSTSILTLGKKSLKSDPALHVEGSFELPRYLDGDAKLLQKLFKTANDQTTEGSELQKMTEKIGTFKAIADRFEKSKKIPEPAKTAQFVIDEILKDRLHPSHTQACNLLSFLAEGTVANQSVQNMNKLIPILFDIVTPKIDQLNGDLVAAIATKCAQRVESGDEIFYNVKFMNALPIRDIRIIAAAARMGHVDEKFLDLVCSPIHLEKRLLNPDWLLPFVHLFGTAGCLPPRHYDIFPHEHFMKHKILNRAEKTIHSPHLLVQLILDLLAMGCKPPFQFLEKIFQPSPPIESYVECGLTKNVGYGPIPLLLISGAYRHLHPDPTIEPYLPSPKLMDEFEQVARNQGKKWRHPIEDYLENSFGGRDNVLTDLWHDGVHIDHCIILYAQDGLPLSFNDKFVFPKQFPNQLPVLVKVHPRHHYVANKERLRGVYELEAKVIQTFGLPVVHIDLAKWRDIVEGERFNFLVNQSIEHCWHNWGEALRHALSTFTIKYKRSKKEFAFIDTSFYAEGL